MNTKRSIPRDMVEAPLLDPSMKTPAPTSRTALLINPFYPKDHHGSLGKHVLTPSLSLTSLAGATPDDWEVSYWDENLLQGPPPGDPFPAVVGITVHLTFARRAYELAAWYRKRGARVILGGQHVLSCPEETARHADAIALGNGVQLWPQILRDAENGSLKNRYVGTYTSAFDEEPPARRAILPKSAFLTTMSLIATRGCHNRCDFCYLGTRGLRMPQQCRGVNRVAEEFAADGQPYGVFIDNNLGSNPAYLALLCKALRPVEKVWSAAVSMEITDDPEVVRAMASSGCTGVFVGLETLNRRNLADAGKRSPEPGEYERRVEIFHRHGIQVNGSFVLGFDNDEPDVFEKTISWVERVGLSCATFHILTPYPGTPFFRKLEAEGRLLHTNWDLYDTSHAVFRPKRMSPEVLEEGYAWCYERLFSHRSIWKRKPREITEILPYLAMTYLYKRGNWFWPFLIRHRLTARAWRPLVEAARRRHLGKRRKAGKHASARARAAAALLERS